MTDFGLALEAQALAPEIAAEDDLYGRLIGSWSAEVVDLDEDGTRRTQRAEIHFARVLEGRAVQDLWIVPPRDQRRSDTPRQRNRYGTTLRVFDASLRAWRVTWINPVSGVETRLVGRRVGDDIVQEGEQPDGSIWRWSFREISATSFRWVSHSSKDGGRTWMADTEFFATRA